MLKKFKLISLSFHFFFFKTAQCLALNTKSIYLHCNRIRTYFQKHSHLHLHSNQCIVIYLVIYNVFFPVVDEFLVVDECSLSGPQTFAPKLVLVDFSDPDSLEEVVSEVVDCYGYVDVLICNSSIKVKGPVQSISLEVDRNIMDINYFGPCTLAKGVP